MSHPRVVVLLCLVLSGCPNARVIQTIALSPGQKPVLNQPVSVDIGGVGSCTEYIIDWSDLIQNKTANVGSVWTLPFTDTITYSGWPGGKTVTVKGTGGCIGTART